MATKAHTKTKPRAKAATQTRNGIPLPVLKKDEHWAGIILSKDGAPNHHLILLPGEAGSVTWAQAKKWAKEAGGELPTRREQSLLFANLKEHFQSAWYWSGEQHATNADWAWMRNFGYGSQDACRKVNPCRARAVRRIKI